MKKITRIEDVYCVPKTEGELNLVTDNGYEWDGEDIYVEMDNWGILACSPPFPANKLEIPVEQFLDLLVDKITHWRLLEAGFKIAKSEREGVWLFQDFELNWDEEDGFSINVNAQCCGMIKLDITTFTELLQQMKFLGWTQNEEQ